MHSLITELAHLTGTTPPPTRVESVLPLEEATAQAVDHIHYLKESFASTVLQLEDSWAAQAQEIMEVLADKDRAISSLELHVRQLAARSKVWVGGWRSGALLGRGNIRMIILTFV